MAACTSATLASAASSDSRAASTTQGGDVLVEQPRAQRLERPDDGAHSVPGPGVVIASVVTAMGAGYPRGVFCRTVVGTNRGAA